MLSTLASESAAAIAVENWPAWKLTRLSALGGLGKPSLSRRVGLAGKIGHSGDAWFGSGRARSIILLSANGRCLSSVRCDNARVDQFL